MGNSPETVVGDGALANTRTLRGLHTRLKHDAKVRDPRVRHLVWKLRKLCPWIGDSDMPAARAWAQMNLLAELCFARLKTEGITTASGEPKKLIAEYRALRSAELAYAKELGLTPAARKTLATTGKGFDLAAEFAALNAREADSADDAESPSQAPTTP